MPTERRLIRTSYSAKLSDFQLIPAQVANGKKEAFRDACKKLPIPAYDVEQLMDGGRVLITKAGGKGPSDFQVWLVDAVGAVCRPTHDSFKADMRAKLRTDRALATQLI